MESLTKLTKAVSFYFKDDAICPGVVISTLRNGLTYASVVRYNKNWEERKKVVCHVQAGTVAEAVIALSKRFVEYTNQTTLPTNPLEELKYSIIYK